MQAFSKWLLARPHNAVLALTVTLLLPIPQLTGGTIVVFLALAQGYRKIMNIVFFTALITAVTLLILGGSLSSILTLIFVAWLPALLAVVVLVKTQSLTLSLQMLMIVSFAFLLVISLFIPDLAVFWQPYLDVMAQLLRESGMQLEAGLLTADILTISAVFIFWLIYSMVLLFGYSLYKRLPIETFEFGQFKDLDFGRIIAIALAALTVIAFLIDSNWFQHTVFAVFAMFMMQGLAILHWLKDEGIVQPIIVAVVYIIFPILQIFLMVALAFIGYIDVWLGFRRRLKKV